MGKAQGAQWRGVKARKTERKVHKEKSPGSNFPKKRQPGMEISMGKKSVKSDSLSGQISGEQGTE